MKICVFSDSHGSAVPMISAIEREKPELCFFLGDGSRDLETAQARFPELPFYAVRGNCDWRSPLSGSLVCTVSGVRIYAVHGHLHDVKYEPGLESFAAAAREAGASLALFGHTHHACLESHEGITFLNPGTIGRAAHPNYAVLYVEEGRYRAELKML